MFAESVCFLRKNSINLSTFCGKDSDAKQRAKLSSDEERYKQRSSAKLDERYKRYKRYTFESKESSIMLFSAIITYF